VRIEELSRAGALSRSPTTDFDFRLDRVGRGKEEMRARKGEGGRVSASRTY